MKKDNFRTQDQFSAQHEHDCIEDLIVELKVHMVLGDYLAAERTLKDVSRSLHELRKLEDYKKKQDKLYEVAKTMSARGIKLDLVSVR
ncbi:hypothetical protein ACQKMD_01390 [Viridibacillus sp. NPDC096237]|uniref:hypothetical protein n=1 Tax=Viridibacillus sp. NPDC096237 TaxID=3390721 RepID=UPI003D055786